MMTRDEIIKKLKQQVIDEINDSDMYLEIARSARLLKECKVANLIEIISNDEMKHSELVMKCLALMGETYDHTSKPAVTSVKPDVTSVVTDTHVK